MDEIWKPIPGFPGYDVSDEGRVRSYWVSKGYGGGQRIAAKPQRIIRPFLDQGGYLRITISKKGIPHRRAVAYLVLATFVGPRPEGMEVCHKDGIRANNHLDNLRWDTRTGNFADMSVEARYAKARPKLTAQEVVEIRKRYASDDGPRLIDLAIEYSVATSTIWTICIGRTHSHLPGPLIQPRKRLSDETVRTIMSRLEHESAADLAREYGISDATISDWRHGKLRQGASACAS